MTSLASAVLGVFNLLFTMIFWWSYQSTNSYFSPASLFWKGYLFKSIAWFMDIIPPAIFAVGFEDADAWDRYTYPLSMIVVGLGQLCILGGMTRNLRGACCWICSPLLVIIIGFGVYAGAVFTVASGGVRGLQAWQISTMFQVVFMTLQFFVGSIFLCNMPDNPPGPRALARKPLFNLNHKASLVFYLVSIFCILLAGLSREEPFISNKTFNDNALFRTVCMFSGAILFWVIHEIRDFQAEPELGITHEEEDPLIVFVSGRMQ